MRFRLAFKRRFNTQPPEGGCLEKWVNLDLWNVSTHSRPKAAERGRPIILSNRTFQHTAARRRLPLQRCLSCFQRSFNTQPPEGGWESIGLMPSDTGVSTHSRPKAADVLYFCIFTQIYVSTHSRPKAAENIWIQKVLHICFNTQPPDGGCCVSFGKSSVKTWFQHTAARRRLTVRRWMNLVGGLFQHTAARRRL